MREAFEDQTGLREKEAFFLMDNSADMILAHLAESNSRIYKTCSLISICGTTITAWEMARPLFWDWENTLFQLSSKLALLG